MLWRFGQWNTGSKKGRFRISVMRWSLRGLEGLEARLVLSTLRVASWNVFNGPNNAIEDAQFETVLEAMGNESLMGISGAIDVMTLAEAEATNALRIESIFDSLYGTTAYEYQLATPDFGGDRTGWVYNSDTLELLGTQQIVSGMTHPSLRGHFRPVGTMGESDFYVYSVHLKAFGGASDMQQREEEVQILRANANALGDGASIIMAGDFNLTGGSAEAAWSEAIAAGPGSLTDAADSPGLWNGNASFKHLHSWNSDDLVSRLDLHFISGELEDGNGLEYVQGSVRPFGNNGTHAFSQGVTTGSGAAPNVLAALESASDHLPIVSDYEFDIAEVLIEETGGGTAVGEGGATDTYTVVLASTPSADVNVVIDPDGQLDLGAGAGNAVTLTFTPGNALASQTVTVAAVDDQAVEGNQISTIMHSSSSSDPDFDGLAIDGVNVTVFDNEESSIVINEVDVDTSGLDSLEFVEIYDGGVGNMPLDGLSLVFFDGSIDTSYLAFDLDGWSTNAAGFFVAGNSGVTNVDLVIPNNSIQNGADAVALFLGDASDFPAGTSVSTADLIDALVYDTDDADDVGLLTLMNAGQVQINENENAARATESMARAPDGGVPRNSNTYVVQGPTPGVTNAPTIGGVVVDALDGQLTVSESGTTDSYEVRLDSVPTVNVLITITPNNDLDLGAGIGSPVTLTFTPTDALLPQSVNIAAVDDQLIEGQHIGTITYSLSSGDPAYDALFVPDTTVQVLDNDQPALLINEVDADTFSTDALEFVELFDGGVGNVPLDGYSVVFFNGNGDVQYAGFDLDGFTTSAEGFFVLGNSSVENVDLVIPDNSIQNGADAVAVYLGSAATRPNVTTTNLIDAVVYDTDDADDAGLLTLLNPGQPQLNERSGGNGTGESNSRVPDGGVPRNTNTYTTQEPTPGAFNSTPPTIDGDFDNDGDFDCDDVNALNAVIVAATNDSAYDLSQDSVVDGMDLAQWLAEAGAANLPSGNAYLPADANLDGVVDGADFLVWNSAKFTMDDDFCSADFNSDGFVDGADFLIWNSNKFQNSDAVNPATNAVNSGRSEHAINDVAPASFEIKVSRPTVRVRANAVPIRSFASQSSSARRDAKQQAAVDKLFATLDELSRPMDDGLAFHN